MDLGKTSANALRIYLIGASWVGSEQDANQLAVLLPDPEQRRVVLMNQISRLIPEISEAGSILSNFSDGQYLRRRIYLRRESRERVHRAESSRLCRRKSSKPKECCEKSTSINEVSHFATSIPPRRFGARFHLTTETCLKLPRLAWITASPSRELVAMIRLAVKRSRCSSAKSRF